MRSHVIVMGRPLRPGALSSIAQRIADMGGNIETVTQLCAEPVSALELLVRTQSPPRLRAALVRAADETGVDISVEAAGLQRRAKQLVLLGGESIVAADDAFDELVSRAGRSEHAAGIAARVHAGELDPDTALRERAALLDGVPEALLGELQQQQRLTPGAATFVRTLRRLGYTVGAVSGGISPFAGAAAEDLGLDFVAANDLETVDGRFTGRLRDPVIDRPGKAHALRRFAAKFGVPLAQTVAVGAGRADVDMLEAAGLAIAFTAHSALRAAADATDAAVPRRYLDTVLFALGIDEAELEEAKP